MTILISEIHRTSGQDVGFLEGKTADGQCVYVRYKYGVLTITAAKTIDEAYDETGFFRKASRRWLPHHRSGTR